MTTRLGATDLKRIFDVAVSAGALVITAPIMVLAALAIKIGSRGPVLYRQARIGRGGRPFTILKFRTMVPGADELGGSSTPTDDPRVTRVGRFLRRYNLDELPQLFNVLKGDMSIVGPRPEVPRYVDIFSDDERMILSVRPGLTDWATVWIGDEGDRLAGSPDPDRTYLEEIWPEKHRLALEYVQNHNIRIDLRIIGATLKVGIIDRIRTR